MFAHRPLLAYASAAHGIEGLFDELWDVKVFQYNTRDLRK